MSDIKIGDYIRTKDGYIGKIVKRYLNGIDMAIDYRSSQNLNDITKNSPNIIDLIEIGDYVNGKLIHHILGKTKNGETMILYGNGKHIDNKHIKSIVTKEMMKSVEYRVV